MVTWKWAENELNGTSDKGKARIIRCSWVSHGNPAAYSLELYIDGTFWRNFPYTIEEAKDYATQKLG